MEETKEKKDEREERREKPTTTRESSQGYFALLVIAVVCIGVVVFLFYHWSQHKRAFHHKHGEPSNGTTSSTSSIKEGKQLNSLQGERIPIVSSLVVDDDNQPVQNTVFSPPAPGHRTKKSNNNHHFRSLMSMMFVDPEPIPFVSVEKIRSDNPSYGSHRSHGDHRGHRSTVEIIELNDDDNDNDNDKEKEKAKEKDDDPSTKPTKHSTTVPPSYNNEVLERLRKRRKDVEHPAAVHQHINKGKRNRAGLPLPTRIRTKPSYDITNDIDYNNVTVITNPGAGDCLFHCYVKVLQALNIDKNTKHLREIVARSIGPRELNFLTDVYKMAVKEGDRAIIYDYSFMRGVQSVNDLRRAVMLPSYYGDEMALSALEVAFPVHCLVLRLLPGDRIELARRFTENEWVDKPYFALLLLDIVKQHYELVEYKGKIVMRKEDLPEKIQLILACQKEEREMKRREKDLLQKSQPLYAS